MKISPISLGTIHFIGIGGIGMSGIAEILHHLGQQVQGTDVSLNGNVERLREKGIHVFVGHDASHLDDVQIVVVSTAIQPDNLELCEAKRRGLTIIHRAQMLAQLARLKFTVMISGSHGKTTTTSLVASLFDASSLDPTVINGGIIAAYGTNARLGNGEWMIVESDESDGSFNELTPTIAVVTNIDPEHMDHYKTFENLYGAFRTFVDKIPFYGFAVMCADHPKVSSLIQEMNLRKTILTYGLTEGVHFQACNIKMTPGGSRFDVVCDTAFAPREILEDLEMTLVGEYNIRNALASIAVSYQLGHSIQAIRQGLKEFMGVKRRFTRVGWVQGAVIVDDYAHHPEEIKAVLGAARHITKGRLYAVVQPHRYSRVRDLMDDFVESLVLADEIYVAPIYEAGESPLPGVTSEAMIEKLRTKGHSAFLYEDLNALARCVGSKLSNEDCVIFMGAGNISAWAQDFESVVKNLPPSEVNVALASGG